MRLTRRELLATTAATIALAGCTGGGGDGGQATTDAPAPTSTDAPAATTTTGTEMAGPTVQVREHPGMGEILVDSEGMTLYMFDSDAKGSGASTCSGGCAQAWPPLTVEGEPSGGSAVTATLSTFEREDGTTQVAAAGWPLYYFASDSEPGDTAGQGSSGVWWVLAPDGTPRRPDETTTDAGDGPTTSGENTTSDEETSGGEETTDDDYY